MKIKVEECVEFMVVGVKHNERRNGARCAAYWSITNMNKEIDIYEGWFVRNLKKSIKLELELAPTDPSGYGLKRGVFKVLAKLPPSYIRGHHLELSWVFSIEHVPDTRRYFMADFIQGKSKYGGYVPTKFRATDMEEANKKVNNFLLNDVVKLNSLTEVNEEVYNESNMYTGYITD